MLIPNTVMKFKNVYIFYKMREICDFVVCNQPLARKVLGKQTYTQQKRPHCIVDLTH